MVASQYDFIKLYAFYRSAFMRAVRLLIFFILGTYLLSAFSTNTSPKFALFLMNIFIMLEVFYHFKISRLRPSMTVQQSDEDHALNTCTLAVLYALYTAQSAEELVRRLLRSKQANFLLERIPINPEELPHTTIEALTLLRSTLKIAKLAGGIYITPADVMATYLLLTEDQSRLLFSKKIKQNELIEILRWARWSYPQEEKHHPLEIQISGTGIGEGLVAGWTIETKKYTRDFGMNAVNENNSIIGREEEFRALQEALVKDQNNNVLLIGEQGAGKEGLVQKLAIDSFNGRTISGLRNKRILELLIGPLIAGVSSRGDLEARLQAIIEEVSHAGNIILYIPEVQDILGSTSFSMDLSGALYPYLKSGKLPVIASITPGNFKTYLEEKPLARLFTPIFLNEPKEEQAKRILMERSLAIERKTNVIITYSAIIAAVKFGDRYIQEIRLPGSAIRLLEDVVQSALQQAMPVYSRTHKKILTEDFVIRKIEERIGVSLSEPTSDERNLLLNLENKLHERVIGQDEAIRVIAQAIRRLRSGVISRHRPISFLFLGPTGVGKTETAKALASIYFGGENSMIRLDMSEYSDEVGERRLLGAPPGQGTERGELTEQVRDHPYSLILLDEFEKAHPRILDLFLQVLDDGRLTDNKGRTVSFINSLIIATSNAGSEFIREEVLKGTPLDQQFEAKLLEYLQNHRIFKPELLNRFDDIITFRPLTKEQIKKICELMLQQVVSHLLDKDIVVVWEDRVLEKIASEGFDPQFGARPIRRYIQDKIEDLLAQKMLAGEVQRGNTVHLILKDDNSFAVTVT